VVYLVPASEREERLNEALAAHFADLEAGRPSDRGQLLEGLSDLADELAAFKEKAFRKR
jgi:hypothetical protein